MLRMIRFGLAVCLAMSVSASAWAQLSADIIKKHAERSGGKLASLQSLRGAGKTFIGKEVISFEFISQRPNKLRVESYAPQRRVLQVYDGLSEPWISHSAISGGLPQPMSSGDAKDFLENADFDGILINSKEKGYSVDYAGEEKLEGRLAYKLLVMDKRESVFFLWVDAQTYEIVKRSVFRTAKGGRRVVMDTLFKDFRPVGGVLQAHRAETYADGKLVYVMVTDKMEANPRDVGPATFAKPDDNP